MFAVKHIKVFKAFFGVGGEFPFAKAIGYRRLYYTLNIGRGSRTSSGVLKSNKHFALKSVSTDLHPFSETRALFRKGVNLFQKKIFGTKLRKVSRDSKIRRASYRRFGGRSPVVGKVGPAADQLRHLFLLETNASVKLLEDNHYTGEAEYASDDDKPATGDDNNSNFDSSDSSTSLFDETTSTSDDTSSTDETTSESEYSPEEYPVFNSKEVVEAAEKLAASADTSTKSTGEPKRRISGRISMTSVEDINWLMSLATERMHDEVAKREAGLSDPSSVEYSINEVISGDRSDEESTEEVFSNENL